jgi:hypothetical protein
MTKGGLGRQRGRERGQLAGDPAGHAALVWLPVHRSALVLGGGPLRLRSGGLAMIRGPLHGFPRWASAQPGR